LSSILKALKKLEQAGVEKHSEKVWPDSLQSMKEKGKRIRFKRNAMFFLFLFIVLSVFSGGFIFYSFRDSTQTPQALSKGKPSQTLSKGKPFQALSKGEPSQALSKGKPFQALNTGKPFTVVLNQKNKAGVGKERSTLSASNILPDNLRSIKKKIPGIERKPISIKELRSTNTQKFTNAETISASRKKNDKTWLPKVKDDPRIELQALVWSADAKNSFAVINNRIFREGQTFDGILVKKIDKDEVYFKDGRNEWREEFRIR